MCVHVYVWRMMDKAFEARCAIHTHTHTHTHTRYHGCGYINLSGRGRVWFLSWLLPEVFLHTHARALVWLLSWFYPRSFDTHTDTRTCTLVHTHAHTRRILVSAPSVAVSWTAYETAKSFLVGRI